ncbi:hypothetical protein APR40_03860 [Salegentibacter salarius]|uniref:Uncharacterized protein n=1 Tax=Salegentibacter salarius TaxID=435906 RepID=A0A2N0TRN7_9FLAO|nr:hypothetical protein BHS39_03860 [Salegentibacter salarius]PKD17403.1 hypothetical protein APR40_03860 [Salegentibacter salarius]
MLVTKIRAEIFNIQTQTSFLRKINFKACKMNNQELNWIKNDYYLIFLRRNLQDAKFQYFTNQFNSKLFPLQY